MNTFGVWDFEDWKKKYLGSKIDGNLTYLGSEILRAKSNYLGFWILSQSDTLEEQIIMWFWDRLNFRNENNFVSENLVNTFGAFEKFGQHIWGSEEMAWHYQPRHKNQRVSPLGLGNAHFTLKIEIFHPRCWQPFHFPPRRKCGNHGHRTSVTNNNLD